MHHHDVSLCVCIVWLFTSAACTDCRSGNVWYSRHFLGVKQT